MHTEIKNSSAILIFGLSPQGLFLLRELSRAGIEVVAIGRSDDVGTRSRYGRIFCIDSDKDMKAALQQIDEMAISIRSAYVTSDYFLNILIEKYRDIFSKYSFSISQYDTVRLLSDKVLTYEEAGKFGISIPKTCPVSRCLSLDDNVFPIILKWRKTPTHFSMPFKTCILRNRSSAEKKIADVAQYDDFLTAQQLISGKDISYAGFYRDGLEVFSVVVERKR